MAGLSSGQAPVPGIRCAFFGGVILVDPLNPAQPVVPSGRSVAVRGIRPSDGLGTGFVQATVTFRCDAGDVFGTARARAAITVFGVVDLQPQNDRFLTDLGDVIALSEPPGDVRVYIFTPEPVSEEERKTRYATTQQTVDGEVKITATVAPAKAGVEVFFEKRDPDDPSLYEPDDAGGDNLDTGVQAGVFRGGEEVSARVSKVPTDNAGKAEIVLKITSKFAGDNYQVLARCSSAPITAVEPDGGTLKTGLLTAWKKYIVHAARMPGVADEHGVNPEPFRDAFIEALPPTEVPERGTAKTFLPAKALTDYVNRQQFPRMGEPARLSIGYVLSSDDKDDFDLVPLFNPFRALDVGKIDSDIDPRDFLDADGRPWETAGFGDQDLVGRLVAPVEGPFEFMDFSIVRITSNRIVTKAVVRTRKLNLVEVIVRNSVAIGIGAQAQVTDGHFLGASVAAVVGKTIIYTRTINNFSGQRGLDPTGVLGETATHELFHAMDSGASLDDCMLLEWQGNDLCLMNSIATPLVDDGGVVRPRSRKLHGQVLRLCVPHLLRLRENAEAVAK